MNFKSLRDIFSEKAFAAYPPACGYVGAKVIIILLTAILAQMPAAVQIECAGTSAAPAPPMSPGVSVTVGKQEKVEAGPAIVLNAQQLFNNAVQLKNKQDFDAAAHAFMQLYQDYTDDPLAPRALYMAAEATAQAGREAAAVDLYETLVDRFPDAPIAIDARFRLAQLYEKTGRADDAVRMLRQVSENPDKGYADRASRALVELYLRLSRIYEAQTVIEKHLKKNPGDLQFLLQLAKSYEVKEEYESAAGIYKKILEANPGNRGFENKYFNAVKNAGKLDELIGQIEQRKAKNPGDMAPYHTLKRLYQWDKKSLDELNQLEVIVKHEPGNLVDAVELAKVYYDNKWVTKAKETLEAVIAKNPAFQPAWRQLGNIYFQEKDMDRAREAWEKAAGFNPDDAVTYRTLAGYYLPFYLHDEVAKLFEKGRKRLGDPNLFAADLANLYYNQMQFEKALGEYVKLLMMNPNDKNAANMIYRLATKEEVADKGIGIVEKAAAAQPGNLQLQLTWLDILMTLKKGPASMSEAERAASRTPVPAAFLSQLAGRRAMRGAHKQAARLYEAAAGKDAAQSPFFLLQAARSWLTAGDMDNAARLLRRIVDDYPGAPGADEALMKLAGIEEDRRNYKEARGYYARLASEYPAGPWFEASLVGEARTTFSLGEFARAAESFDALAKRPGSSRYFDQILFFRAETKLFSSKIDEAKKLYRLVMDQYPESRYVNDALERLFFLEDMSATDPIFIQAFIAAEKKNIKGDAAGAVAAFRKLAAMMPEGTPRDYVFMRTGDILLKGGELEAAAKAYSKILEDRQDPALAARAGYRLAVILEKLGRDKEALRRCQDVITNYPASYWGRRAGSLARGLADKFRLPTKETAPR